VYTTILWYPTHKFSVLFYRAVLVMCWTRGEGWAETWHRYSIQLKISRRETIEDELRCTHAWYFGLLLTTGRSNSHRTACVGGFRGRPHLVTPASIGPWYIGTHRFPTPALNRLSTIFRSDFKDVKNNVSY